MDTKRSDTYQLPPCSVVQGGKLSTTLYTLYTNEVPTLKEIMKDSTLLKDLTGLTNNIKSEVDHNTYNFVDDSNNSIIFDNPEDSQEYVNIYMSILKEFYNLQKLQINEDKTMLFINSQPKHREGYRNIEIKDQENTYSVKPQSQIKILGFIFNERGSRDAQIAHLVNQINLLFIKVNKNKKYMCSKTRAAFVNANVLGRIMYYAPSLAGETEANKNKIYKLIKSAARFIRGSYCYMESIRSLMKSVKLKMPQDILDESSAKYSHKVIITKEPQEIYDIVKLPRSRACADLSTHYAPKTDRVKRSTIFSATKNYNRIPSDLRPLEPRKLKIKMKKLSLK